MASRKNATATKAAPKSEPKTEPAAGPKAVQSQPEPVQPTQQQLEGIMKQLYEQNSALKADLDMSTSINGQLQLTNAKLGRDVTNLQTVLHQVCNAAGVSINMPLEQLAAQLMQKLAANQS